MKVWKIFCGLGFILIPLGIISTILTLIPLINVRKQQTINYQVEFITNQSWTLQDGVKYPFQIAYSDVYNVTVVSGNLPNLTINAGMVNLVKPIAIFKPDNYNNILIYTYNLTKGYYSLQGHGQIISTFDPVSWPVPIKLEYWQSIGQCQAQHIDGKITLEVPDWQFYYWYGWRNQDGNAPVLGPINFTLNLNPDMLTICNYPLSKIPIDPQLQQQVVNKGLMFGLLFILLGPMVIIVGIISIAFGARRREFTESLQNDDNSEE